MSKQSDAKERQQYVPKAVPHTCVNCANFNSDLVNKNGWIHETNMRCAIGQFAVKKMGTCLEFSMRAA